MANPPYLNFYLSINQQVVQKDDVTLKIDSQGGLQPVVVVHFIIQVLAAAPEVFYAGGKDRRYFIYKVAHKIGCLLIGTSPWAVSTVGTGCHT